MTLLSPLSGLSIALAMKYGITGTGEKTSEKLEPQRKTSRELKAAQAFTTCPRSSPSNLRDVNIAAAASIVPAQHCQSKPSDITISKMRHATVTVSRRDPVNICKHLFSYDDICFSCNSYLTVTSLLCHSDTVNVLSAMSNNVKPRQTVSAVNPMEFHRKSCGNVPRDTAARTHGQGRDTTCYGSSVTEVTAPASPVYGASRMLPGCFPIASAREAGTWRGATRQRNDITIDSRANSNAARGILAHPGHPTPHALGDS
jgi:hypothetical protein